MLNVTAKVDKCGSDVLTFQIICNFVGDVAFCQASQVQLHALFGEKHGAAQRIQFNELWISKRQRVRDLGVIWNARVRKADSPGLYQGTKCNV